MLLTPSTSHGAARSPALRLPPPATVLQDGIDIPPSAAYAALNERAGVQGILAAGEKNSLRRRASRNQPCITEQGDASTAGCAAASLQEMLHSGDTRGTERALESENDSQQLPNSSGREAASGVAATAPGQGGSIWGRINRVQVGKKNNHILQQIVQCVVETCMLDFARYSRYPATVAAGPEAQVHTAAVQTVAASSDFSKSHLLHDAPNKSVKPRGKAATGAGYI